MLLILFSWDRYRCVNQKHAGDAGKGEEDRGATGVNGAWTDWGGRTVCGPQRGAAELTQTGSPQYVLLALKVHMYWMKSASRTYNIHYKKQDL